MRKAFDLVDYKLLLVKLRVYKMSENSFNLFNSYLTERNKKSLLIISCLVLLKFYPVFLKNQY